MNYLVDSHILIWCLFEPEKLSKKVIEILKNRKNNIFISKISLWEISLKYSLGKIEIEKLKPEDLEKGILKLGFEIKELEIDELLTYHKLIRVKEHKDPFDRMLIWQSIKSKLVFISRDSKIENYKSSGLKFIY